ncbi:MAG: Ig-like domain-containing protein, partial [Cyclobacteriaceae bacterium]
MKRITLLFFLIFFSSFLNESFSKEVFSGDNLLISPTDIDEVDCSIDENLKDNKAIDNSAITLLAGLEVQSVTPTFGTRNVAKDATIQLTFNESIDGATLNSTGILIWGDLTGPITGTWTGGGTSNITFTPTRDFNEGEVIRIEVNPALSSVSAVAATKFNSTFRVATTFLPAIASWTKTSYPFTVTTGDGDGRGGTSVDIDGPRKISLGDLSSDGTLDFGVASRFEDAIRLITSSTSSGTTNFEVLQTFPKADDARSVQLADLNNDGELDAVFASANDGKVEWRNNDGGTFSSEVIATNAGQFRDLAVGDVDGDGDLDIITVSVGNNIVRFYEHNGDYSNVVFAPSTISSNLSNPNSVTIAQLTATGNPHIIVTSYVDDRVSAYQYQNGSFVSSTHANGINGAIYTAVGDLNGDGVSEIVSAAFLGNKIFVHSFDTTTNSISAGTEIAAGLTEIQAVQLFDIDGDGDLDIIAAGAANGLIRWYENDGNAGFTAAAIDIDAAGGNPVHFVVADINDNGYPNILVADLGNDQITMYSANPGFFVTESSPAANSINISSSSTISLDFSKSLNTGTVNGTNIKVRGQQSGIIAGNWVVNGAQAAFTPSANLLPGEVIHVEVSETVLDADGEAVTPAAYSFTVLPEDNETLGQYWLPVESGVGQSNWQAVTYGEGRFVAVSRAGTNNVMYSEDGLNWTGRTVISCGYSSVTYGGGRFVGVCRTGQGRVMYSDDGETWTEGVGAVEEPSFSVTYGNGRFVAVANQHVIYSYDGVNWSAISDPEAGRWESVTYGNGRFVAVASSGTNRVMHSVDGISWTPASATEANSWLSVTYGNGRFVAVASSGANRVMHSVDGISWTAASATEANSWISVTYGNGRFIAVAESGDKVVMYSEDGVSWISALDAEANTWQSVYYGNSRFVAVASNGGVMRTFTPLELSSSSPAANAKDIAKSANIELTFNADLDNTTVNTTNIVVRGQQSGVIAGEWSVSGAVATFDPTNDLTEGEVIHVEIGTDLKGASGELTVEDDAYSFTVAPAGNETLGEIWAAASATEANIWISVTYGGGRFVAVAETGIHRVMYSDDGIAWTAASATEANRWKSVTYGDGRFVAVADDGVNQIMYSDDGVSWTTTSAAEVNSWKSITYGNGRYVAVASSGTNRVMYSDDGEIWTAASAPEEKAWGSITYGNGRFVAVSNFSTSQNQVMYSDDGISWTSASASEANQWQSVTYGNGRFVAVTNSGSNRVMYSNDGEIWTAASAPEENSWMSIAYGNGRFVAVSNASSNQNQGMYSDDGITWTAASAVEASGWRSVTYGNGRFLAVANSGTNRVMYTLDPLQLASSTPSANAKDIAKEADIVLTFDADLDNTTVNPTNIVVRGQQSGNIAGIWSVSGAVATFDPTNDLTDGEVIHVEISANVKSTDGLPFGLSKGLSFTVAPVGNENLGQNWMSHSATESNFWRSVTYGNGRFVAVSIDGTNRLMYSDDGISWTASSGVESNIWVSVTYGNGRYVAVASSGTNRVMYSDDGISWSPASASENNPWRSVTYGNGRFVAVATGGDNQVMYSEDGVLWNTASSAEPNAWRSVTYGNGRFVAVSMSGTNRVMYSDDGVSWTVALVTEGNDWSSVTYGNGRFVAVADFARTNSAMYSTDGVFWTETTVPEKNIWTSVSYGNGRFVAVSETGANRIMYSNDGIKWIKVQSLEDNSWQAITYGNGQFVAVSSDGTNRVMKTLIPMQLSSSTPTANATSIAKDANIVLTFDADLDNTTVNATNIVVRGEQSGTIAGEWSVSGAVATFDPTNDLTDGEVIHVEIGTAIKGVGGELLATAKAFSFTVLPAGNATLGQNWTTSNSAADNSWRSVTFGNGLFVAIGESGTGNRVMTSPDGIEWTSRTSAADNGWSSVTFGNGLFVAVGESGTGNRVMTSPDGIVWTSRTSAADNLWSSVTFGNGLFVAVSTSGTGNRVMTSPDGITWTSRSSSADYSWYSVTYGNGLFVAVSYSGTGNSVMTSPDGITWTTRASANDYVWYSVTYGNGLFVATALSGSGNRVMTSPDGIVWTSRTSAADNSWLSVTYGNGLFVATAISGSGNRVMTSPDGIDWTSRSSAADNNWASVTYGNGRFVAVSYSGTGNRVMRSLGETVTFSSSNLSPANNEQNVDLNASLRITFEKAVQKGTGTIEIRKSSDDQVVASIDASSNQVSISDKVASISPSDPVTNPGLVFEESTQYYFIIPGSAFVTAGGEQFEGISDKTTWTFTTASSNPTLASSTPTNNATKVSLTDSLVFKFSENITLLDASKVTISGDGSPSTAFVRVRNDSLIVGPSGLVAGVTYTAIIAAGAIENSSNDLNEEIHVSFRTLLPKLAPIAFYPGDGAVGVPLDTTLSVKFNQALFQHPEAVQVGAIDVIIDGTTYSSVVSIQDSTVTIDFNSANFVAGQSVTASVSPSILYIVNEDGLGFDEFSWTFTSKLGAPKLVRSFPANNATNISEIDEFYFVFDQDVTVADSNSELIKFSINGAEEDVFNESDLRDFEIFGDSVVFENPESFKFESDYTVTLESGLFQNASGDKNETITISFSTSLSPPSLVSTDPAFNSVLDTIPDYHYLKFDKPVQLRSTAADDSVRAEVNGTELRLKLDFGRTKSGFVNDSVVAIQSKPELYIPGATVDIFYGPTIVNEVGLFVMSSRLRYSLSSNNPELVSSTPSNNATKVSLTDSLVFKFNQNISLLDAAKVTISGDGSPSIAFVRVRNDSLILEPSGLTNGTNYTVTLASGTVENAANEVNEEIQISFTTLALLPSSPVISSTSPANGGTDATVNTNIDITFSENVLAKTGEVAIYSSSNTPIETFSANILSISGAKVTINPSSDLSFSETYYVLIDQDAFETTNGVAFAGISDDQVFRFTTAAAANNVPTASNQNFTGTLEVNQQLTGSYTYTDADSDPESGTTLQWYVADNAAGANKAPVSGANAINYTLTTSEAGKFLALGITPNDGKDAGPEAFTDYQGPVVAAVVPTIVSTVPADGAVNVSIDANLVLTLSETVTKGTGNIVLTPTSGTVTQIAVTSSDVSIAGAVVRINPTTDLLEGQFYTVIFDATAFVDADGNNSAGLSSQTAWNFTTKEANVAPVAQGVSIKKSLVVDGELQGSYTYFDDNGDAESGTVYSWYRSDDNTGTNKIAISGAATQNYTVVTADNGKYLTFEVTPSDGTLSGEASESAYFGPILINDGNINIPPAFTSDALTSIKDNETYTYTVTYEDINNDVPVLTKTTGPAWLSVTGFVLSGSPTASNIGDHQVVLTLDDQNGGTVTQAFTITVIQSNTAPSVSGVELAGTSTIDQVLTGSYNFIDAEQDTDNSTFKWYRSDDASGSNKVEITSATSTTYTLTTADADKYISFEVTPNDGTINGTTGESALLGPIGKKTPSLSLAGITKVYGDAAFDLSATTNSSGTVTYTFDNDQTGASLSGSRVTLGNVGQITVNVSLAADAEYAARTVQGTITVSKRPITFTAQNASKVYGAADPSFFSFDVTQGNLVSDAEVIRLSRDAGEAVGTYSINLSEGEGAENYDITTVSGTFTITKVPITVTAVAAT